MSSSCQKFLDSSTHILNLIPLMINRPRKRHCCFCGLFTRCPRTKHFSSTFFSFLVRARKNVESLESLDFLASLPSLTLRFDIRSSRFEDRSSAFAKNTAVLQSREIRMGVYNGEPIDEPL